MKLVARLKRRRQQQQQEQARRQRFPPPPTPPPPPPPTGQPAAASVSTAQTHYASSGAAYSQSGKPSQSEEQIAAALASELADDTPSARPPSSQSGTAVPSISSSPSASPADSRDQITFNLQILSDHGIVLCPGFHRASSAFTSAALLADLKRAEGAAQLDAEDFPALKPSSEVESRYSPTILPPAPPIKSEDGTSGGSGALLDELLISFGKGAFNLLDGSTLQSSFSSSSASPSLSVPSPSSSAAASAMLKRLSLTGWRSSFPSASSSEAGASTFPPSSALPSSSEHDEEDAAPHPSRAPAAEEELADDDRPTARTARAPPSSTHVQRAPTNATSQPAASASPSQPAPSTVSTSPAVASTPAPTIPSSLWSSISSWLFPRAHVTPAAETPAPAPSAPASPPPPPPYYSTLHRIVIIGIHGWSLLGGMLGEKPMIISSRFCYYIQQALLHFLLARNVPASSLHVTCIPLYGHGRIEERVSMYLDSQLPLYATELREADHIIIACHSQGCMVTSSLLHVLLTAPPEGLQVGVGAEDVTVLMLAGLHHGPFPDLSTDLYTSTKELFFYSQVHSQHSQQHLERMAECITRGVKVLLIGSVHDQVVPLYSSLAHMVGSSHNLLRAMYVDYAHYSPDFLYSFLSLLLFLSNRPRSSQSSSHASNDVLPHISGFVRGSLLEKQGGAHSAMHRCVDVYGLGVEWAMSGRGVSSQGQGRSISRLLSYSAAMWSSQLSDGFTSSRFNKHLLQLRVKEMMEQLRDVHELSADEEARRLEDLYDRWQPKTKNLRLLKETLQPVFASHSALQQHQQQLHSNL